MLSEVFYWVLNMSITGTIIGLFLQFLRPVRKIPRFIVCMLWSMVLIRLVLPFGIANRYSLMNLISKAVARTVAVKGVTAPDVTATNFVMAAEDYFPIVYRTSLLEHIFRVSSVVWLVVAITALLILIVLYRMNGSAIKKISKSGEGFFYGDYSGTPFVYGIFRPKIIVPAGAVDFSLKYILAHERVHIKRLDNLWRMVALATACIYWFNPLIWYFVKAFFTDMEFACDEKAVRKLSVNERKEYAASMLKYAAKQKTLAASAFGGSVVKKRIENVLSYKTMSLVSSISMAIFVIIIVVTLLTNASV